MTETSVPALQPGLRSAFTAELRSIDVRQSGNGEEFTLTGHAAVFDSWSEELGTFAGTFREKITPGAFTEVLERKPDVRLLFNHDGMTLARTKSNTLELSQDDEGLRVWARLSPDQTIARDLRAAMLRGDVDQMSFAFTIAEDEWHEDKDTEEIERTIIRVGELYDVSVVSFPAYPDAEATIRDLRTAAEAGLIHPTVAQPETDAAGDAANGDGSSAAPDDPVDAEPDPLAALRAAADKAAKRERESYLRLLQEISE